MVALGLVEGGSLPPPASPASGWPVEALVTRSTPTPVAVGMGVPPKKNSSAAAGTSWGERISWPSSGLRVP